MGEFYYCKKRKDVELFPFATKDDCFYEIFNWNILCFFNFDRFDGRFLTRKPLAIAGTLAPLFLELPEPPSHCRNERDSWHGRSFPKDRRSSDTKAVELEDRWREEVL